MIQIVYSDPLAKTDRTSYLDILSFDSYRHEKRAIGGYWSASIGWSSSPVLVEDWIQDGLGRHIEVYNDAMSLIWEGFVDKISASLGRLSYTLGPLTEVANKVKVCYSTIDTTADPPIIGSREFTAWYEDTTSQNQYGILELVLQAGGMTAANAAIAAQSYLAEHKEPETSKDTSLQPREEASISLECLGYWHLFNTYTYNDTTTGTRTITDRIQDIIGTDPNGILSTDYSFIDTNPSTVNRYEYDYRTGEGLLKALNALGDASFNRYNMGVYAGRRMVYKATPSRIEYHQRIFGDTLITDVQEDQVQPYDVEPARWIFFPDFLAGRLPPVTRADFKTDPRVGHIETVQYTYPSDLEINGRKISQLDQMLARWGLAGVGA